MRLSRDLTLIYAAALLRSLGIGLLGVLLGIYLFRGGASSLEIGLMIAAGLGGGAGGAFVVSVRGGRLGRRRTLIVLSLPTAAGGLGLALIARLSGLFPLAFAGRLNGIG